MPHRTTARARGEPPSARFFGPPAGADAGFTLRPVAGLQGWFGMSRDQTDSAPAQQSGSLALPSPSLVGGWLPRRGDTPGGAGSSHDPAGQPAAAARTRRNRTQSVGTAVS